MAMPKFKLPGKIRINPIVKKDLKVISRSMKIAWGVFIYEMVLALVFFFAMYIIFDAFSSYGYTSDYQDFIALFPIIAGVEFCIIALIMPVITASAISGEKEKQTFDLLMTTVMTPRAIVRGKVESAVIRMMVFIVGSIPLMALSFTIGGLSWWNLFVTMIAFLIFAILTGSMGIFASTLTKKSITGIILTYVFYFIFGTMSVFPTLIVVLTSTFASGSVISVLMLINPVAAVIEMFMLMLGGDTLFSGNPLGFWSGWGWVVLSGVAMLLISWGLQRLAAWRIDPLHGYIIQEKRKKKVKGVALN
ncbi:MAG: ABC transporter permease [Lachnospiraceae bacterium]|nr:ABC transporter permease [Lachnospiraceae bacterium]